MMGTESKKPGVFCNMRMQLYYAYISEDAYPHWAARATELPPARRVRVAAKRLLADRARSVAVTALLQHALYTPLPSEGVGFCNIPATALSRLYPHWEADENGRPFPAGIDTPAGRVWVSVSHSGGHLLVAVADSPVGADVQATDHEALSPERFSRLDRRIAHPAEHPATTPVDAALRWAAKEAAVKLTGRGLATSLCRLQVSEGAVWDETGAPLPLFWVEYPGFVAAAVVKVAILAG